MSQGEWYRVIRRIWEFRLWRSTFCMMPRLRNLWIRKWPFRMPRIIRRSCFRAIKSYSAGKMCLTPRKMAKFLPPPCSRKLLPIMSMFSTSLPKVKNRRTNPTSLPLHPSRPPHLFLLLPPFQLLLLWPKRKISSTDIAGG